MSDEGDLPVDNPEQVRVYADTYRRNMDRVVDLCRDGVSYDRFTRERARAQRRARAAADAVPPPRNSDD